ncbi:hypothetical protein BDZ45DRAFT_755243 [Acephala macrosclerotiorum]|nr:hypothetical protein BDZ45DRAFT_755243 [Acephala macrosclerotiorum]
MLVPSKFRSSTQTGGSSGCLGSLVSSEAASSSDSKYSASGWLGGLQLSVAVQEIPQSKPLPTPASTPREEPETDGQADQHKNNLVDPHDHSSLAVKQELSQGGRPLYHAYVEDVDDSSIEQMSDNSQRSANLPPLFLSMYSGLCICSSIR